LNFNYLIKQISIAQTSGELLNVYFYMGRFAYLVLYFEPLITSVDANKIDPPQAVSMLASISKVYSNITNSAGFIVANEIANLALSFFENAVGASGENVSACYDNLRAIQITLSAFDSDMTAKKYENVGKYLSAMMQLADPTFETCYYGIVG
jgi:hypothetical protein